MLKTFLIFIVIDRFIEFIHLDLASQLSFPCGSSKEIIKQLHSEDRISVVMKKGSPILGHFDKDAGEYFIMHGDEAGDDWIVDYEDIEYVVRI